MMDRRAFICGLTLGTLAAPHTAGAQQTAKFPRVGYLSMLSRSDPTIGPLRAALQKGLGELGYIEGQTITIEWRFAEGRREQLPELAAELARLKVDLIFTETTPATRAAQQVTTTIPIVSIPLLIRFGKGSSRAWGGRAGISPD